jgi:glycosyltransferase involved in cell wall biosynthesis
MRILLFNDYPMDKYYEDWKKGLTPGQQLWGKTELDKKENFEVVILPHHEHKILKRIGNLLHIQHFDLQIRALRNLKNIDAIYAPFAASTTKFLLILKFFGLLNIPIVAMIHYPLLGSNSKYKLVKWVGKRLIKGYNKMIFLGQKIKSDAMEAFNLTEEECKDWFVLMDWGSETSYFEKYLNKIEEENYVVSNGQTSRDFDTLIKAFDKIDLNLKIYAKSGYKPKTESIPRNVEINTHWINNNELMEIYSKSRFILICFKMTQGSTLGLTSVLDCISMGKPFIITENPYIDLDPEKEGVGFAVKEGDVQGWIEKVNFLNGNPELCKQMGKRCLELQRNRFSLERFGDSLHRVFLDLKK